MENVSIYGKKWLDLVFEGKNKEYGAYKLRQENSKTTLLALLFGSTFFIGLIFLLSSFSSKDAVAVNHKPVVIVHIDNSVYETKPEAEKPKLPETQPQKPQESMATQVTPINTGIMVVTPTNLSEKDIPTTTELAVAPIAINTGTIGTGLPSSTSGNTTSGSVIGEGTSSILRTSVLDVQPSYPGGIKKFYQFVGDNFDKDRNYEGRTVRVNVAFVIEKNGAMTDIKVLENDNSDVAKEAIRVLKSLKTKWVPGVKNGQSVRTQFTLPITVQL
jgi:protein TonB